MLYYRFSVDKNNTLKAERGLSFEETIHYIENGGLIDIIDNKDDGKYPNQQTFVVKMDNYIHLVPFVIESDEMVFLKTVFKDRRANKAYSSENKDG